MRFLPNLSRTTALAVSAGAGALVPAVPGRDYFSPEAALMVLVAPDTSGSIAICGAQAEQQAGVDLFGETVQKDPVLAGNLLVAVTGFGQNSPSQILVPATPAAKFRAPRLSADTNSPLCARLIAELSGISRAGEAIATHCDRDLRPAMAFYFSDGQADDLHLLNQAIHATQVTAREARIEVYLIGVGSACDMPTLESLAQPGRPAMHMRDVKDFKRFFAWLYRSVRQKSQSVMGEEVEMPHPFDERRPPLRGQG